MLKWWRLLMTNTRMLVFVSSAVPWATGLLFLVRTHPAEYVFVYLIVRQEKNG